jgi:hypothetical protein
MTTNTNKGYIYIRDNIWFKQLNIYKLGITTSIIDRSNTYITGEPHRGFYIKIYELNINNIQLLLIDKLLKDEFKYLNKYYDGGIKFYDRIIINKIEVFFN